jgi:hypothetical protein
LQPNAQSGLGPLLSDVASPRDGLTLMIAHPFRLSFLVATVALFCAVPMADTKARSACEGRLKNPVKRA